MTERNLHRLDAVFVHTGPCFSSVTTASLLGAVGCIPIATSGPLSLHHLTKLGASASRKWRYFVKEFLLAIVIVYPLEK